MKKINEELNNKMVFETYSDVFNSLNSKERESLAKNINSILKDAWGVFPDDFVEKHILKSGKIILARRDKEYVGFCCTSAKNILEKKIYYIEFLVVKRAFQKQSIGSKLMLYSVKEVIFKNIIRMLFSPVEFMFITPNVRVLSWTARLSKFVYPNPYLADEEGKIHIADDTTWELARELIKHSDNPNRKIDREGLVIHGSYANTPWLIYDLENIPWDADEKINKFAKRYLNYGQRKDKEFIVRAKIGLASIFKYFSALISK